MRLARTPTAGLTSYLVEGPISARSCREMWSLQRFLQNRMFWRTVFSLGLISACQARRDQWLGLYWRSSFDWPKYEPASHRPRILRPEALHCLTGSLGPFFIWRVDLQVLPGVTIYKLLGRTLWTTHFRQHFSCFRIYRMPFHWKELEELHLLLALFQLRNFLNNSPSFSRNFCSRRSLRFP